MIDLSVIFPVHNEGDIIQRVFQDAKTILETLGIAYEIILVENGSEDKTLAVINKLKHQFKNVTVAISPVGYGNAVITGLSQAKGRYVCYMPSDGQVDFEVFPRLWKLALKNQYDIVKVRRINRENLMRVITSHLFSVVLMILFRVKKIDVNGSPRILSRKTIGLLKLKSKDSFIDAEMAIKAKRLRLQIGELPMRSLERLGGASTRSIKTYWEFIKNIIQWFFQKDIAKP